MRDDHFEYEEDFHGKDPKQFRKERKILSKKDRSKFKKTDLEKRKREVPVGKHLRRGRVLAILADGILVDCDDHLYTCTVRGSLKKEQTRMKNLIAVGDFVLFEPYADATGSIAHIEERRSVLSRSQHLHRRKEQLIAVNIDQVLITTSVVLPPLKPSLIDRYLIATLKGNMDPVILVNKVDLLKDHPEERALLDQVMTTYQSLDIPIIPLSAETGEGLDALKEVMEKKSSVFSGQSGTGKSSIINRITGSDLRIGAVIEKTRKGAHTTTSTHLLPIGEEGFCIDTPGIKSFGMWELKREEVQDYYPEIKAASTFCRYPNCSHLHEPKCNVRKAVEEGKISRLRFDSYCALIAD